MKSLEQLEKDLDNIPQSMNKQNHIEDRLNMICKILIEILREIRSQG